jgi:excisionase family DNA binding protein
LSSNAKVLDMDNLPPMLTVGEVGQILRIPRRRLYDEMESMGIPFIRVSPLRIRIPREAFIRWVEKGTNKQVKEGA